MSYATVIISIRILVVRLSKYALKTVLIITKLNNRRLKVKTQQYHIYTHTHTHTHTHIYIYIYIYIERETERERERGNDGNT
jgi:hypothetical protein